MNEKFNPLIVYLALYYREPLNSPDGNFENPRISEARRWYNEKFHTERGAEMFTEKVKEHFKPTSTVPFPLVSNLVEIWNIFDPPELPDYTKARIENKSLFEIDYDKMKIEGMNNKKKSIWEPDIENFTDADIRRDSRILSSGDFLKKYGLGIAGLIWSDGTLKYDKDSKKFIGRITK